MNFLKKVFAFVWSKHFLKHLAMVAGVYIIVVAFVVFYLDSYTNHGQKIEVPNLIGKNVKSIEPILEESDLKFQILDSIYDPKKPEGTILEQDPLSTKKSNIFVKEGRIIRLRVSKKSRLVEMPNLLTQSIRFAQNVLENRGINFEVQYKPSTEANGAVLEQKYKGKKIKGGERIPIGAKIVLVVGQNEGGEPVQIPDLYGLTISEAKSRLQEVSSLTLIVNCPECANATDSTNARIILQSPEYMEGVLSPAGTTITVNATLNFP